MNIRNYEIESIQFTEITNNQNLRVTFSNHGAEIFKIVYKNYVLTRNVKNIKDSFNPAVYNGRTVGRVSNRMRGNKFSINGETFELEANEDGNVLHGGPKSIAYQMFEQKIRTDDENIYLTYFIEIRDLEDGYPGNLRLEVRYIVPLNEDEIRVQYRAFSDKDSVLSLTNHSYFTLGCKNIEGLSLQINADKYLDTDPKTLLKVGPKEVNSVLDFRETKRITQDISDESLHTGKFNGYDHFYYLNNKGMEYKACSLSNKRIQMDVYTNFEGVQIYTSGFSMGLPLYPETDEIFDSVAIEPSDSFEKLHLLKKDTLYFREIKYIFLWKE